MYQRILAAVDGSERAEAVTRAAREVAERFGGRVFLYRALELPAQFPAAAANVADDFVPWMKREAEVGLRKLAGDDARVSVEPAAVLHGQPWRDIIATAARLEADLIVIGSHGYGGWDAILGTTAGKVVNHADRSVLVVHLRAEGLDEQR